jgi:hypothetical protein
VVRKAMVSALAALAVCCSLVAVPGGIKAGAVVGRPTEGVSARSVHLGPYATIRRANEVAAYYRSRGYNASTPYHNGDGYYVDVW